jgi:hypothetical protein
MIQEITPQEKYCSSSKQSHSMLGDVLVVLIYLARKQSCPDSGNDDECCSEPSAECSGIDIEDSVPKISPDAPIIEPIMKSAVKVHHYNSDESDSARDI